MATKATKPAALLRLLLEALQEAEPATKATAALVGELHPLPCPAPIDAGAWSEDAFFAASHDRERGEATLWRWDRLDAPPRALAILAGEIHGITPSPDGTALVLTNYHAARPDRHGDGTAKNPVQTRR